MCTANVHCAERGETRQGTTPKKRRCAQVVRLLLRHRRSRRVGVPLPGATYLVAVCIGRGELEKLHVAISLKDRALFGDWIANNSDTLPKKTGQPRRVSAVRKALFRSEDEELLEEVAQEL